MANVIDELVVLLGLDASKFKQGVTEATRGGKTVEQTAKGMQEAMGGVERGLLRLAGAFAGFAGLAGFAGWVGGIIKATAELGRLQTTLGTSAKDLWAWQQLGAQVGATADDITGSYKKMNEALNDYISGTGQLNAYYRWFARRGVDFITRGPDGKMRVNDQTTIYTQALNAVRGMEPQRASGFLRNLGLGEGTVQTLMQFRDNPQRLRQELEKLRRESELNEETLRKAAETQREFNKALTEFERLGREIGVQIMPAINTVMKVFSQISKDTSHEVQLLVKAWEAMASAFRRFDEWLAQTWIGRMAAKILGEPAGSTPSRGFSDRFGNWEQTPQGSRPARRSGDNQGSGSDGNGDALGPVGTGKFDRSSFLKELEEKPWLKERLQTIVQGEVGHNASRDRKMVQLETIFNRAKARGQTLEQATRQWPGPGGYYPASTFSGGRIRSPGEYDKFQKEIMAPVLAGSDRSTELLGFPATGNASGGVASRGIASGKYTRYGRVGPETYVQEGRTGNEKISRLEASRIAQERTAASGLPVGPGGIPLGGSNSGGTPQQRSIWERMKSGYDKATGQAWGQNVRAIPWLQPGGMSIIKGIPQPVTNNSSTSETHIGSFTVNTEPRSNPYAMAAQVKDAIQRSNMMDNNNSGPN